MATDTQFTPGPWGATFDDGDWYISGHIGRMPTIIADVQAMVSSETVEANAHLIAAAPELYSLAEQFERVAEYELRKMEREKPHDDEGIRLRQLNLNLIRATIAKVRAEQVPA